jgi:hypothetical protein
MRENLTRTLVRSRVGSSGNVLSRKRPVDTSEEAGQLDSSFASSTPAGFVPDGTAVGIKGKGQKGK